MYFFWRFVIYWVQISKHFLKDEYYQTINSNTIALVFVLKTAPINKIESKAALISNCICFKFLVGIFSYCKLIQSLRKISDYDFVK